MANAVGATITLDGFNCTYDCGEFAYSNGTINFQPMGDGLGSGCYPYVKPAFDVIVPGAWNFIITNLNNGTTAKATFDGHVVEVSDNFVAIL